jgi:hypothetical protein
MKELAGASLIFCFLFLPSFLPSETLREDQNRLSQSKGNGSEFETKDQLQDIEDHLARFDEMIGRTKASWKTFAFFRSTSLSQAAPTLTSQDCYVGVKADVEKFFEKQFSGFASIRFIKRVNADDLAQVDLLAARMNYSLSWIRLSVGRQSFARVFGSTEFLGDLITAGIHRMDAATVTIPLAFTADIDDKGGFKSPPSALLYGYAPRILSSQQTTLPDDIYSSGLHFGQFRLSLDVERWGLENIFKVNVSKGVSTVINSSPLSNSAAWSAVYELTAAKDYKAFLEYGIQNSGNPSTSAVIYGARVKSLRTKIFVADEAVFEMLNPLAQDRYNALTGGSPQTYGIGAVLPAQEWYARVFNRIGRWEYGAAATNSWGDFTFGRVAAGALSVPVVQPLGPVNEIDDQAVPLLANDATPVAYYIYSEYSF